MAFHFWKWLTGKTGEEPKPVTEGEFFDLATDLYIRELAFQSCVNLAGNALSKCEFKTFEGDVEKKGAEYYLWNIEPNQNQNSTAFLHKLVHQLYNTRTALVVDQGGKLYVADSYVRREYALYEDLFEQVTVGEFTFGRTFSQSEVLFFELTQENMRRITNGLYLSYGKLIAYGMKGYQKSRGEKGTMSLDVQMMSNADFRKRYEAIQNADFRRFAEAENAILPVYKGMDYTAISSKTYSADSTRDIRSMIDDVTDFTARGFGIPPALLNGSVQDVSSATDQLLTFCVDPLADNIQEEINRKRYGKAGYLRGNYLRVDTSAIKHIDLLSSSGNIDKLVSSGVVCINDIRGLLGQPLINEPWAWEHFITKNYATVEELLKALEGGETV
ncbi:phage portal protein [Pseudoflavonifractor phocaeensis]|uniref:phage portal protein n=1 Tax=Pseudoflavonifractor phocaeensis TaxID=1870988 RepID=UPI00313BC49F